jgi:hypothetical protein
MRDEVNSLQSAVSNVHAPGHARNGGRSAVPAEDDQAEWAKQEQQVRVLLRVLWSTALLVWTVASALTWEESYEAEGCRIGRMRMCQCESIGPTWFASNTSLLIPEVRPPQADGLGPDTTGTVIL